MSDEDPIAISALEHYEYCPRQCALIHADGLWVDNHHTVRGQYGHRRADSGTSSKKGRTLTVRSVPLWSVALGLKGRADAIEVHVDGAVIPVEYKMGTRHGRAADVQLCAQAMCLEEMLDRTIDHGFLWLSGPRRRQLVALDSELRATTVTAIRHVRSLIVNGLSPVPVADERCCECQLAPLCLPGVVRDENRLGKYLAEQLWSCAS